MTGEGLAAADPTTTSGEIARDVTCGGAWCRDFDTNDRLDDNRTSILDCILKCAAPGCDECHFLRIDRMMFAVIDDDAHVLKREARYDTFFEHLTRALLHRWDELRRNGTADHFIH